MILKKWKLITIMIFLGYIAPAKAQNISVNFKNITIKEAMETVKKQTGKSFFFNVNDVDIHQVISFKADKISLEEALKLIFKKQNITFTIKGDQIIVSAPENSLNKAQKDLEIKGKVVDENGNPLIGVSIFTTDNKAGTISDIDGNFTINTEIGNKLEFSYIGYKKQQVKVTDTKRMLITLTEDQQLLEEVVVVGYGTQKKANLTGAVAYLSGSELENRPVANLGQALQGAIPNINVSFSSGKPGEATNINIRGVGSINGHDAPLILIDGVEGSIDNLNPRDVESISVLKDASSAAIYGARAAFGVVLITTKSGNSGKMKISYNGRYSFSKQTTRNDFVTTGYDAAVMVDEFMRSYNGTKHTQYDSEDMKELEARRYDTTEHPDRPWVVEKRGQYMYYANFDWYNYMIDATRPTWNHNISMSGGTQKLNYNISGNYYNQKGIYKGNHPDHFKVFNLRARIKAEVTSWLDFDLTTSLNSRNYWAPGINYGSNIPNMTFDAFPFLVPVNPDGTNVFTSQVIKGQPAGGIHSMIREGNCYSNENQKTHLTTVGATFKLYKGLTLKGNYSYRYINETTESRTNTSTHSQVPGKIETSENNLMKNKLRQGYYTNNLHVIDVFFNYENTFAKNHNVRAVTGFNYESFYQKRIYATKLNIQSDILNDFNLGENTNVVLGGEQNSGQVEYALMGFFGRLGYDYKGKYLAEVNLRRDATSRFPKKDRAGFFPSVSLGWRISDESFFKPLTKVISNLKFRGSYGALGNQKTSDYYPYIQSMKVLSMNNYILDGTLASYTQVGNPLSASLTWESIYTTNLGIELGLFNGRLTFSGDVYRRDTKGMLMPGFEVPKVYGAVEPLENGAELRTKGYELTLGWNDNFRMLNKNFNYHISASLADNTTKVTKYDQNANKELGKPYVGMEWGEIWGYQIDGLFATNEEASEYQSEIDQSYVSQNIFVQAQGAYRGLQAGDMIYADLNGNKKINNGIGTLDNHGDLKKIGNRQPRYTYSTTAGFEWFGLDCSAFFQGIGRQHIYPGGDCMLFWGGYARPYSSFVPKTLADDIWTPENPDGYFPKQRGYAAQGNRSLAQKNDRYLQNLAYCRLKNFTLGYTLPQEWSQKLRIDKLRIYFSGDNLLTWTKLRSGYIDPEQFASDGNARVYPYPKTFSFGIDINL